MDEIHNSLTNSTLIELYHRQVTSSDAAHLQQLHYRPLSRMVLLNLKSICWPKYSPAFSNQRDELTCSTTSKNHWLIFCLPQSWFPQTIHYCLIELVVIEHTIDNCPRTNRWQGKPNLSGSLTINQCYGQCQQKVNDLPGKPHGLWYVVQLSSYVPVSPRESMIIFHLCGTLTKRIPQCSHSPRPLWHSEK